MGRLVAVPLVDDALRVGDGWVVQEQVDVVVGRQDGADIAVQDEVRLDRPFDGLFDLRGCVPDDLSELAADVLLSGGRRSKYASTPGCARFPIDPPRSATFSTPLSACRRALRQQAAKCALSADADVLRAGSPRQRPVSLRNQPIRLRDPAEHQEQPVRHTP